MPDEGGDAACWAELVCDECGLLVRQGAAHWCGVVAPLDSFSTDGGPDGVVWALTGQRQVDANLVALGPNGEIGLHHNSEVDVLIVVLVGSGRLTVAGTDHSLAPHDLALIPRGAARRIAAGAAGMRFLSIHRARSGLTIERPHQAGRDRPRVESEASGLDG